MAINRKKIIDDLSKINIMGNENGLIPAFGVLVNQVPAKFWNKFADRLVNMVEPDMLDAAEYLLVDAARTCGYHTGYGIITSDEWNAVVKPMVENVEDVLHGAFAVFTAWGWAKAEIVELVPGEKMVVRAYDYYESDTVSYGKSTRPCAYMIRGVCAAFFALAYAGEYDAKEQHNRMRAFNCAQTKGIECGDDYGEFVVTKA